MKGFMNDTLYASCRTCYNIFKIDNEQSIVTMDNAMYAVPNTEEYALYRTEGLSPVVVTTQCPHCHEYNSSKIVAVNPTDPQALKPIVPEVFVRKSRYTPHCQNGKDIAFRFGETVRFRGLKTGNEFDVKIDSELMTNSGYLWYECIFPDGRYFVPEESIVDWEGKVQ